MGVDVVEWSCGRGYWFGKCKFWEEFMIIYLKIVGVVFGLVILVLVLVVQVDVLFWLIQVKFVEEVQVMCEQVLLGFDGVDYQLNDGGFWLICLQVELQVGLGFIGVLGVLYGDYVVMDLVDLVDFSDLGVVLVSDMFNMLVMLGIDSMQYIFWMQVSYIMVVSKEVLLYLLEGVDIDVLIYDELIQWFVNVYEVVGELKFGFLVGFKGLKYCFF